MQNTINIEHFKLIIYISLWCILHSTMISITVTEFLKHKSPDHFKYYRLFFNIIAFLTLVPLIWYKYTLQSEVFFNWDNYLGIVQILFVIIGIILFLLGANQYDSKRFLGLSQLKEDGTTVGISQTGELNTSGILSIIRHPWYTGLLLVLWAQPLDLSTLILNLVLTIYLFIGVHLEERKLIHEFGDTYITYQKNVSMLIPAKWILSKFNL